MSCVTEIQQHLEAEAALRAEIDEYEAALRSLRSELDCRQSEVRVLEREKSNLIQEDYRQRAEIKKKARVIERLKILYLDAYGVVLGCACPSCAEKTNDAENEIKEAEAEDETT